ncbi:MAG: molybdate ABC transporter substrate-binding protein [Bacteroidota bacterium]
MAISVISCQKQSDRVLLIATASNMQDTMRGLIEEFEEASGIESELSVASSRKLATQIQNGAPFNVFVSADTICPYRLFKEQLTIDNLQIYAYGKLCLCSMESNKDLLFSESYLAGVERIAIANPEVAPYGRAAQEALRNVYPNYQDKLVRGESVGQAALFVKSGAAEVGILSKSLKGSIEKEGGTCRDVNPQLYSPIAQAVVILKTSNETEAIAFRNFLLSDRGKEILNKFGYSE